MSSIQLLHSLLNSGVPVDVKDSGEAAGNTLLHWASSYSTPEVIIMLCGTEMALHYWPASYLSSLIIQIMAYQ